MDVKYEGRTGDYDEGAWRYPLLLLIISKWLMVPPLNFAFVFLSSLVLFYFLSVWGSGLIRSMKEWIFFFF